MKSKKLLSCFLALVILFAVLPVGASAADSAEVSAYKTSIEKKYSVKIDINPIASYEDDSKTVWLSTLDDLFTLIPSELHNALVKYYKNKGKTITIRLAVWQGSYEMGSYDYKNDRITLYTSDAVVVPAGMMDDYIFAHEYGHMLHFALKDIYGTKKFTDEWIALNNGQKYGAKSYDDSVWGNIFVSQYGASNIEEDVADTFAYYSSRPTSLRTFESSYYGKNIYKKVELLEQISKSSLNVNRIYHPAYVPIPPGSWSEEAISRAFSSDEKILGYHSKPEVFSYAITRREFCEYLRAMMERTCEYRYGKSLSFISEDLATLSYTGSICDPKTGKITFVSNVPSPFSDATSHSIFIVSHLGIITGTGTGRFEPNGTLTREQAAVFLERACKILGISDAGGAAPVVADASNISSWAKNSVDYVLRNGIMSGTGNGMFSPKQTYSVEQSIVTLVRVYDRAVAVPAVYSDDISIALQVGKYGYPKRDMTAQGFKVGQTQKFTVLEPMSEQRLSQIVWSSSNPSVAEITSANREVVEVKLLSEGTATITATDATRSDSLTISVKK